MGKDASQFLEQREEKKRKGRAYLYRAHIGITMTKEKPIKWVKQATGVGTVLERKPYTERSNKAYRWGVWSRNADDLCRQILPYLVLKRAQAKAIIRFQKDRRHPGRNGLTCKERQKQIKIYNQFRVMNKRGVL